jgi:hypothetical protein
LAPTDTAFTSALTALGYPTDYATLATVPGIDIDILLSRIISYHSADGYFPASSLSDGQRNPTFLIPFGRNQTHQIVTVGVDATSGDVTFSGQNTVTVIAADLPTLRGDVVHSIDTVLLWPDFVVPVADDDGTVSFNAKTASLVAVVVGIVAALA